MSYDLLNLEAVRQFLQPKRLIIIFLILLLKAVVILILLKSSVFEVSERWSGLGIRAATHGDRGGIVIILRGPAKRLLEMRDSIATIINCVILVFIWKLLIRNFLLVILILLIIGLL
jgi:hypothetical protein